MQFSVFILCAKLALILVASNIIGGCKERLTAPHATQETTKITAKLGIAELAEMGQAGNADAQFIVGMMYFEGKVIPKDSSKAVKWLHKSAVQGNATAQYMLGTLCAIGDGVPKDDVKASEWYLKAADQGNANAQTALAMSYDNGRGVPKNPVKALDWYQKAASQGESNAQLMLAGRYVFGNGVPQDSAKAAEWLQKSAAQGNAISQSALGSWYAVGKSVPKDIVLAYAWKNLAASNGDREYAAERDKLQISSEEKSEAQSISSDWKKGQLLVHERKPSTTLSKPHTVVVGTLADTVLEWRGKALSSRQVGRDDQGVIVEWRYGDATYLMGRRLRSGIEAYRVIKITPGS